MFLQLRALLSPSSEIFKLGGLQCLEIDHWFFLEYISPHSFQGLNLSWLSITNTISTVPMGALHNLIHLASLDLSYNPISVLESWALRDLVRLKELHLVGTNLLSVQPYGLVYKSMYLSPCVGISSFSDSSCHHKVILYMNDHWPFLILDLC